LRYGTAWGSGSYEAIILKYCCHCPPVRKDVWEKDVKRQIFGVPESTLIGALSAAGMLWMLALSSIAKHLNLQAH